jgi:hypothetical protein
MVKNIYLTLFVISLVLSSVYVFEPGLPQPADFLLAFLIMTLATGFIVRPPVHKNLYLAAGLFLGYVTVISLFWRTQYETMNFILTPLYYVFNFATLVLVVSLLKEFRERFVVICQAALASAIALEIVALFLLPPMAYRALGTFNNPNQLGYWALLAGACVLVLRRDRKLSLLDLAVLFGAGYLTLASLSKAAMLSFALLLVLALVCQGLTRPIKVALLGLVVGGMAIAVAETSLVDQLLSQGLPGRVADRFDTLGKQGDDSLRGRGYDRIWRYPEHLVFGAGEGASWRFGGPINPRHGQMEMHSSLGTVLFSYGIIGFSLFLAFLAMVFRRAPLTHMFYSLPIWAYGMTHQGLRDTMLWIFFGLVFGVAHYAQSARPQPTVAAPAPHAPLTARGRRAAPAGRPASDPVAIGARQASGGIRWQPR